MKILVAGFEPFGGSPVNPAQKIVQALQERQLAGLELCTAILPVDRLAGPEAAIRAIQEHRPDAALCLGLAAGRQVLSIERVAINLLDYRIPDNAGQVVNDQPVVEGGPAAYFVTLPVRTMLAAITAAHVPAELSLSAGAFLCNQVLYAVLHHAAANHLTMRAGFIHVPSLPEQVADRPSPAPSMSLDTMITGVSAALQAIDDSSSVGRVL